MDPRITIPVPADCPAGVTNCSSYIISGAAEYIAGVPPVVSQKADNDVLLFQDMLSLKLDFWQFDDDGRVEEFLPAINDSGGACEWYGGPYAAFAICLAPSTYDNQSWIARRTPFNTTNRC